MSSEEDQALIAAALASIPPPDVPADFVTRVSARIDESEGWFGVADFRAWTLRLAPLAAGLGLIAMFWPGATASTTASVSTVTQAADFSPASPNVRYKGETLPSLSSRFNESDGCGPVSVS